MPSSPSSSGGVMVSASTHCEAGRTITQEVYKIATFTEGLRDPSDMTLRIVTHSVGGITSFSKVASKQSTRTGRGSSWASPASTHSAKGITR